MAKSVVSSSITLEFVDEHHPLRRDVESYVKNRYSVAFDARLQQFMPVFLVLVADGEIVSACGYRVANIEPLFLEQYLDESAEQAIGRLFDTEVDRAQLIEFGQLASFSKGLSAHHFLQMTRRMVAMGFDWCIFTATDPLYAMMRRLGLQPQVIVEADASRVINAQAWGTYYHYQPRIMAGDLKQGLQHLEALFSDELAQRVQGS
ncbi:thermostable hemolysin [Vibrio porteresiae]|uniref:Thermostable hemolysin n=1 Tax=Vibrio porteresiae DSM 19223 TaxID=1123496 RepID=A0ABZ0QI46_9VIBR|nr:thermostable hemolysin [Vibrio porteresiae]WPC76167.1 thermostable hemolysin [Vibrio porteresiae DSM 19223]